MINALIEVVSITQMSMKMMMVGFVKLSKLKGGHMYKALEEEIQALNIDEIALIVDEQPRLQEFVRCLYTNERYQLNQLRELDARNYLIALTILKIVYPECRNVFSKHF